MITHVKLIAYLLVSVLSACGQDDSEGDEKSSVILDRESTNIPVDKTEKNSAYAMMLDNLDSDCNDQNLRQLVYVLSEERFYVCDLDGWSEIDINGKDGQDGSNGENGIDGIDGESGENGRDYNSSDWIDPVNGRVWYIGGITNIHWAICDEGYKFPDRAQISVAARRGLFAHTKSLGYDTIDAWYDLKTNSGRYIDEYRIEHGAVGEEYHLFFCYKE